MSAIIPIAVTEVTPTIGLVLNPQQIQGNLATYYDTSGGVPLGFPRLTASLTRPGKGNKYSRVRVRLAIPVLEPVVNVGDAPVLGYENFADITFTFSDRSTLLQRQVMNLAFADILADTTIKALIEDLEMLY